MVMRMERDEGPDPTYAFGAWSDESDPDWPAAARRRAFAYAGKYGADELPMPPTDDAIIAMLDRCVGRTEIRWVPDIRQAIAMNQYAGAAFAIARAVHQIACPNPRPGYPVCRCGTSPNPYGPWRT